MVFKTNFFKSHFLANLAKFLAEFRGNLARFEPKSNFAEFRGFGEISSGPFFLRQAGAEFRGFGEISPELATLGVMTLPHGVLHSMQINYIPCNKTIILSRQPKAISFTTTT